MGTDPPHENRQHDEVALGGWRVLSTFDLNQLMSCAFALVGRLCRSKVCTPAGLRRISCTSSLLTQTNMSVAEKFAKEGVVPDVLSSPPTNAVKVLMGS